MKSLGQNKCNQSVMIADTAGFVRFGRSSFRVSLSNSVRGSIRGSFRDSFRGSVRGSFSDSFRGSFRALSDLIGETDSGRILYFGFNFSVVVVVLLLYVHG